MIDYIEALLEAWGQEQINPGVEVSIRSPLGQLDEISTGFGGSRCLSLSELYAAHDQHVLAVEQALRDISDQLGAIGRQLTHLAEVRYATAPALPLAGQYQVLTMSRDVYRARVDRLRVEVAARYPGLISELDSLAAKVPATQARQQWLDKVRRAARKAEPAVVTANARAAATRADVARSLTKKDAA